MHWGAVSCGRKKYILKFIGGCLQRDLHTYDISSSALQRLRILLQKLAHRGLTWQDGITQQVISRELSKLRNVPLHHQATPPAPLMSSRNRKLSPELSRNLQQYLKGMGFLSESEGKGQPQAQQKGATTQVRNISKKQTNSILRILKEQTPFQPVGTASCQSTRHSAGTPGGEASWPKGKLHYLGSVKPSQTDHAEPQPQVAFGSETSRPNLDRLLFKAGSNRLDTKEPLSVMDERFIQNVVSQLGRHSINMEALMGKDLDELAGVITGALQEVHEERPGAGSLPAPGAADSMGGGEGNKEPLAAMVTNQNQDLKSDKDCLFASPRTEKSATLSSAAHTHSTSAFVSCAVQQKQQLEKETGLKIVEAGVSDRGSLTQIPVVKETRVESGQFLLLSVLCMLFILVALAVSATFFCVRQRSHLHMKEKLASLGTDTSTDATATYQELCRQRMAIRTSERVERPETLRHSRLNSVSSQFSDGPAASPSTRSSTSSWCEEPVPSNMDISTGHMILSYMEDHLKNKNRLEREWEALCSYQAEPGACNVGHGEQNSKRNRSDAVVAYDHSRITLKAENNHSNSDYINASPIMDHDPRNPTYIASQGPLPSTVADFWQMVWESGCVVIVMLTPLSENGVKQCHHYWPDEGSDVYHIYEVNLVSEHIWCEDFLVRSFYLKNLQTNETRTVTQFHFLSWMDRGIPNSARTLLDFRRKVNKCYRGRSCPIIVHCSDGAGRSGTYILIDMVLNKMAKGAKEIDIAATLEHLRDQRAGMVQTKEQFEFALTAVAEEVNAILKALPQ
uniref:Protein tyrosine phosphatase receptor type N2 n=1 Tax=Sphaeramia orbicularis TaxID=375764 RepID=A0A673AS90_9TELE